MSITIIKPGLCDTIQDWGRAGFRHLGINPSGVMDKFSTAIVNALAGNTPDTAVLEMHFPAATLHIDQDTLLAIGGGDFSPMLNGAPVPLWQPVIATAGSTLRFDKWISGARTYIAFREQLQLPNWLGSYSTHLKAGLGGWEGRSLQKKDCIGLKYQFDYSRVANRQRPVLPWNADVRRYSESNPETIYVIAGPEFHQLDTTVTSQFASGYFTISHQADRMGYLLQEPLSYQASKEILSSATSFGTIQLLPEGKLIVLMADHQVTGGYPRIAQVATVHLPKLAQLLPGSRLRFQVIQQQEAERLLWKQQQHLLLLQQSCKFKLEEWLLA